MKTIRKIQNVIAVIALATAIHLATKSEMTISETVSATIMVLLTVFMLLERSAKEIQQNK